MFLDNLPPHISGYLLPHKKMKAWMFPRGWSRWLGSRLRWWRTSRLTLRCPTRDGGGGVEVYMVANEGAIRFCAAGESESGRYIRAECQKDRVSVQSVFSADMSSLSQEQFSIRRKSQDPVLRSQDPLLNRWQPKSLPVLKPP